MEQHPYASLPGADDEPDELPEHSTQAMPDDIPQRPLPSSPLRHSESDDLLRADSQLCGREGARTATSPAYTPNDNIADDDHDLSTVPSQHHSLRPKSSWSKASIEPEHAGIDRQWWSRTTTSKIWWWEISCCIIALGALLGIVGTIRSYERKEAPQWKFGLNVNAIIAIFSAALKAAAGLVVAEGISHLKWIAVSRPQLLSTFITYDEASRGPLGALQLIWENQYWSKGLQSGAFVSSLGALVTILMLILDPFSQQIIQTYHCEKDAVSGSGSIPRTNVFYKEVSRCRISAITTTSSQAR
jgi:hypothetical protein